MTAAAAAFAVLITLGYVLIGLWSIHLASYTGGWKEYFRCSECGSGERVQETPCRECGAPCRAYRSVGRRTSYFAPWRKTRWEWRGPQNNPKGDTP